MDGARLDRDADFSVPDREFSRVFFFSGVAGVSAGGQGTPSFPLPLTSGGVGWAGLASFFDFWLFRTPEGRAGVCGAGLV